MTNAELKSLVETEIKNYNIAENTKVEFTKHKTGYCVCLRCSYYSHFTNRLEWSLPATFMVYRLMTTDKVKEIINRFFDFHCSLLSC